MKQEKERRRLLRTLERRKGNWIGCVIRGEVSTIVLEGTVVEGRRRAIIRFEIVDDIKNRGF